jgi:hypothetical protein
LRAAWASCSRISPTRGRDRRARTGPSRSRASVTRQGPGKDAAIREAARLLRPGARIAIVDGFLVDREPAGLLGWIYRRWCAGWAIGGLGRIEDVHGALWDAGFDEIEFRDLFWHVAPSAAHVPFVATLHMLRALWESRGRLSPWRWRHIAAIVAVDCARPGAGHLPLLPRDCTKGRIATRRVTSSNECRAPAFSAAEKMRPTIFFSARLSRIFDTGFSTGGIEGLAR